jgi:hypothetical protein
MEKMFQLTTQLCANAELSRLKAKLQAYLVCPRGFSIASEALLRQWDFTCYSKF